MKKYKILTFVYFVLIAYIYILLGGFTILAIQDGNFNKMNEPHLILLSIAGFLGFYLYGECYYRKKTKSL